MAESPAPRRGAGQQPPNRAERRSGITSSASSDLRTPFQRDRDRVLYSEYFRRLAGVTQVASAAEGSVYHNRLTHSLKVGQVARRLCERLVQQDSGLAGRLDPDVVECAALAHDLGHPPFGHIADYALAKWAEKHGLPDAYEGNAQTFRILTRLSVHRGDVSGLDLTRASLAAVLKYPWKRARSGDPDEKSQPDDFRHRRAKFCVYDDDVDAFTFAVPGLNAQAHNEQTLEAQIMDISDAITYSVHDLEDFYRAGLIPVERLVRNEAYRDEFLRRWEEHRPEDKKRAIKYARTVDGWRAIKNLLDFMLSDKSEPGSQQEAVLLERFRSMAITHLLEGVTLRGSKGSEKIHFSRSAESRFLQRLVFDYVILSPRLATQQAGQEAIVRGLADFFFDSLENARLDRIPTRFTALAQTCIKGTVRERKARLAVDIVASLTEAEAASLYRRVTGQHLGSLHELVV